MRKIAIILNTIMVAFFVILIITDIAALVTNWNYVPEEHSGECLMCESCQTGIRSLVISNYVVSIIVEILCALIWTGYLVDEIRKYRGEKATKNIKAETLEQIRDILDEEIEKIKNGDNQTLKMDIHIKTEPKEGSD